MSYRNPVSIKKQTPSPCYFGMWPGIQDSGDGRTTLLDISGKGRHLQLGANATYGAVTGTTAGYAAVVGAASPTNKSLATTDILPWDMFAGQSLLVACTLNAAAPGASAHLFNARGAGGDVKGMSIVMDPAGKPQIFVRDTAATVSSGVPTDVACDSTPNSLIVLIDGTNKKAYGYLDGVALSTTGTAGFSLSGAVAGSTQCDDPARWGMADPTSNPTWVAGANLLLRHMHVAVMPYWPTNYLTLVAELVKNPHRPLSARLLPALASA